MPSAQGADIKIMSELPGQSLDVTWPATGRPDANDAPRATRPWLGIYFECCDVYARVFRQSNARQYVGQCPKCGRSVRVAVGPGGVPSRLFRAKVV
jgi:hypothetical protein